MEQTHPERKGAGEQRKASRGARACVPGAARRKVARFPLLVFRVKIGHVRRVAWLALIAIAAAGSGCESTLRFATREACPLSHVGSIAFGQPVRESGAVIVPLTYQGGGWQRDSAISPYRTRTHLEGKTITFTVLRALAPTSGPLDPRGRQLKLPSLPAGTYEVEYLDPDGTRHRLGQLALL